MARQSCSQPATTSLSVSQLFCSWSIMQAFFHSHNTSHLTSPTTVPATRQVIRQWGGQRWTQLTDPSVRRAGSQAGSQPGTSLTAMFCNRRAPNVCFFKTQLPEDTTAATWQQTRHEVKRCCCHQRLPRMMGVGSDFIAWRGGVCFVWSDYWCLRFMLSVVCNA